MALSELRKMKATADESGLVHYELATNDGNVAMNSLVGEDILLRFTGKIKCIACGKSIKKTYGQGYCYPCYTTSPETEDCVLRPHLCQAHLGIARDLEYATQHCLIEHYVYLAISGGLKVGVTRHTQIPTRWIDQGASQGLIIAKTPNRHLAGAIEVELMKTFSDKTNWRSMLTNIEPAIDLYGERERLSNILEGDLKKYLTNEFNITPLTYPVSEYPVKVSSLNFDKNAEVKGKLQGIRGQYLIFAKGEVINLRSFTGYEIDVTY